MTKLDRCMTEISGERGVFIWVQYSRGSLMRGDTHALLYKHSHHSPNKGSMLERPPETLEELAKTQDEHFPNDFHASWYMLLCKFRQQNWKSVDTCEVHSLSKVHVIKMEKTMLQKLSSGKISKKGTGIIGLYSFATALELF